MSTPLEVVAAPFSVWLAPLGTAMPTIDATPSASWFQLGTSGILSQDDSKGVVVTHTDTKVDWTSAGATMPQKVWRTAEQIAIEVAIADISVAQYGKVMNDATVTTVAQGTGVAGNKYISLELGQTVALFALLCRGVGASPETEGLNVQYEVPRVYQGDSPAPAYSLKGKPALLQCKFMALKDSVYPIRFKAQTSAAL